MKLSRFFFLSLFAVALGAVAFSEDGMTLSSRYAPLNAVPSLGSAVEGTLMSAGGPISLAAYPQAELLLLKLGLFGVAPFDLGIAATGRVAMSSDGASASGDSSANLVAGFGAGPTLHFGLRGLRWPLAFLTDMLDVYSQVGFGYDLVSPRGIGPNASLSVGTNFFVTDSLMVGFSFGGWTENFGYGLHLRYRFGATTPVARGR